MSDVFDGSSTEGKLQTGNVEARLERLGRFTVANPDDFKNPEIAYAMGLLRRRWLIVLTVLLICVAMLPVIRAFMPASHKATADMLIVSQTLKDTTLSDPDLPSIITSTEVLKRVIHRLNLNTDPISLAKHIKTKVPAKSSILEITYEDKDAVKAATIANAIADESSAYFHEVATHGYNDAIASLRAQIAVSQKRIGASDELLQSRNAFASSDKVIDGLTQQVNDLQVQRGQLASSLAADQSTANSFKEQLHNMQPVVRGEILQKEPVYQQLQAAFAKDVATLAYERASYRDSFPSIRALAEQVQRERLELRAAEASATRNGAGLSASATQNMLDAQRADGAVAADQERLRVTIDQLAAANQRLRQAAAARAATGALHAQRDANAQQYTALSQRLETAQGDAAQAASLGTLVVISRAVPGPQNLGLWPIGLAVLVVALAIGAAIGVDALDGRFRSGREVEKVYGRPVFAEIERRS